MPKKIVFRVEDRHGKGPYSSDWFWKFAMASQHTGCQFHPPPWRDGCGEFESFHYCGFESLEKAVAWFAPWFERLYKCDFSLNKYEVDEDGILTGDCQIMFEKRIATKLETIELHNIPLAA